MQDLSVENQKQESKTTRNRQKGLHDGHRARLRKRFIDNGLDAFADHEILELILTYCLPRKDVNELGHIILNEFGSLSNVFDASYDELINIKGLSEHSAVLISMFPQLVTRYLESKSSHKQSLSNTKSVFEFGRNLYHGAKYEKMYILCLDSKCRHIRALPISDGTIDTLTIYPRVIIEQCLLNRAHGAIIMHNHPSGDPHPSVQDVNITKTLVEAFNSVQIRVYDHVIITYDECFSFNHNGLIKNGEVSELRRAAEIKK